MLRQDTRALPEEIHHALSALDHHLIEALQRGDIRLVRSKWLLSQPASFRIAWRQKLEEWERDGASPSPLLSPQEAVALVRRGDRSAGVLSYGWTSPGNPDPTGERVQIMTLDGLPLQVALACGPCSGVCADDTQVCATSVDGDHAITLWNVSAARSPSPEIELL